MSTSLGQTVLMNDLTPARVASTGNVTGTYYNGPSNNGVGATLTVAASSLVIDGVTLQFQDRVLLQGQTNTLENGIYIVSRISTTVVLTRAFDQQNIEQLKGGQFVFISAGTGNAGSVWCLTAPLPNVIGVDAFNYVPSSPVVSSTPILATAFNGMFATPILLVPAPGANKLIVLDKMEIAQTYGSAAFAGGGVVAAQYDSTINGAGVKASNTEPAADFQVTASNTYLFNGVAGALPFTTTVNKALYLSNATAAFTGGTLSTLIAKVHYHVIATV